jgi:type I restriction enzyme R subunit
MNNPNENTFQTSLIEYFKNILNYTHKTDFNLFNEKLRDSKKDFLLKPILFESLKRINKGKSDKQIETAILEIEKITDSNLILANKKFNDLIRKGINTFNEKTKSYELVFLFDKNNFQNNDFLIVDEFEFTQNKNKRCDLVIFLNGIPISIIELKNPNNEKATIHKAYTQIKNYQNDIKNLFITNCFNSISNLYNNGVGTITSEFLRYNEFKNEVGNNSYENHFSGLYSKKNLLDIIFNFLIFTKDNIKILANYHQFFCVNKIIDKSILVNQNKENEVGVVWHTTGSGKSYTMTFYSKKLIELLKPLIIVLTDRIDLDDQLFTTFSNAKDFLGVDQSLKKINSREDLINKLNNNTKSEIIFTTIQKFSKNKDKLDFEKLSNRDDIFIIVDEAHRSQYGTEEGFAKNLRDALPNAKFLGFSGTPIELEKKNTKLIFGDYIDKYVMSRAIRDETTVPIKYEPRLAKIGLKQDEISKIDNKVNELFKKAKIENKDQQDFLKMEAIIGNEKRLKLIAQDFIIHFERRNETFQRKSIFTCISRLIAVKFYNILKELKPEWFSCDNKKGEVKIIMSGSSSDKKEFQEHIRTRENLKEIENRFKDENDSLKIAIVIDMWLTGFDVPCLNTIYIDKPIKQHNLIQAISRVNRIYPDKDSGLIVDYIGIGNFLKLALNNYSNEDKKEINTSETDFKKIIKKMIEKYELTKSYLKNFDYSNFFKIENNLKRLEIVRDGTNHISTSEENIKNYLLNSLELLKAYSLCPLSNEAKKIVNELNYFKLVRAGLSQTKNTKKNINNKINLENELSLLVSKSIETKNVIDIYDFVGIKKPEISILNEEFFDEIRNLKQKNLAFELLKKVLNDKIKIMTKGNVVLEKKFSEKLIELVKRYENKTIESAKIIEDMISLSTHITKDFEDKKKLGLSDDEIKFYSAVSQINNKEKIMKEDILKDLTKELVFQIRENKTTDWNKREDSRAKMRLLIKRLLKKYGYPPKEMEEAKKLVIKQAELFCEEI